MGNEEILEKFKQAGMNSSYHYADDTASGEWRLGQAESAKCYALAKTFPELVPQMKEIAKGFLFIFNPDAVK